MRERGKWFNTRMQIAGCLFWMALCAAPIFAAQAPAILFVGDENNHVASGLRELELAFQTVSEVDLVKGTDCLFDYRVLVFGMDVRRAGLGPMGPAIGAFVKTGGVVLSFRSAEVDPWLPVPLAKDRAYAFGKLLLPEHPIFTTPHEIGEAQLRAVHSGSIYAGFYGLSGGWQALISAGKQQGWDKQPSRHKGDHFGLIELEHGRGKIVMCQMIPAYAWFNDSKGDADTAGAHLFENLVHHALGSAVKREGPRKPRVRPEAYAADLANMMRTPQGCDGLPLDAPVWRFTSQGPFTGKVDRRGVYTISHGKEPSRSGNFGQLERQLEIPAGAQRVMLRVYQSDDYCGGQEPKMVGDARVSTSLNVKQAHRFRQVLIDDTVVIETDVLGRNIQPARERIKWHDVTDAVGDKRRVTLALRVIDRQGSGEATFSTDCYFAAVDFRVDLVHLDAARLEARGYTETDEGMALSAAAGSLSAVAAVPQGNYVVAFRLLDDPFGQGSAEILVGGQPAVSVGASADDYRFSWVTTKPISLEPGTRIVFRATGDGEERMVVSEMALIPADLLDTMDTAESPNEPWAKSPAFGPTPAVSHQRVSLSVSEPSGATRTGEVTSQAVQFAFGALGSAAGVAVTEGEKTLPSQVRPFVYWPDRSIQAAVVTFPVDIKANATEKYELHFGTQVTGPEVVDPLTVKETADCFTIDTGRLRVDVPRRSGQIISAASIDGRAVAFPHGRSWELELECEDERNASSGRSTATSCVLAEAGPLRAIIVKTGKLTDAKGELIQYRCELHFTRGSADARCFLRVSNMTDPGGVFIKRLALELPWQTESATVYHSATEDGPPIRLETPGKIELYQHLHDTLSIMGDGLPAGAHLSRAPGRMTGWTALEGPIPLKVGLRHAWQMYPKQITVDDGLTIDLIPTPLTDEDIPEAAKRPPEVAGRTIGGVGYPQALGHAGVFRLAVGQSISHELWFSFGKSGPGPPETQFTAGLDPLRAWPDPAYVAQTRAFCSFHPTDPTIFPRYEKAIDGAYEVFMKRRRDREQYGMENFGDDTFEWGYGPAYTFWSNQEDDRTHGMLMQYVRSGDRRWWALGEQAARHYRDVDCVAASPAYPDRIGGPLHHNSRHFVSQGWVADHTRSTPGTGHSWIEGLIDYWLLTGDLLAEETAIRMGQWYVGKVDAFRFGAGGQERGQGWTLTGLTSIYRVTWDRRYLDAAQRVQDWINNWQDPVRGVISVPISEQPSYEGGTTFMHGIVAHGVARLYEVTGDQTTLRSLQGLSEWIVTEPMGPPGRFWYKQAPSCKTSYGYNGKAMTATSYLYEFTGDEQMATVTEEIFNNISPNIRTMPFLTPTLSHMARWRQANGLPTSTTEELNPQSR